MEPIVIIMVLALIIGVAVMMYVRIADAQEGDDRRSMGAEEDLVLLSTLASMPELSCPQSISAGTRCLDRGKVLAAASVMTDDGTGGGKLYYYRLFGDIRITITTVPLTDEEPSVVVLYDGMPATENSRVTRTYFTLYDHVTDGRVFAILEVRRAT
jgi:hypothetical protein